jgi:hypothetical protein
MSFHTRASPQVAKAFQNTDKRDMISWQEPPTKPSAKKKLEEQEDNGTAAPVTQKSFRILHVEQQGDTTTWKEWS